MVIFSLVSSFILKITRLFFLTVFSLCILESCGDQHSRQANTTQIPNALKESDKGFEISSKRGKEDLVESLYNELAAKSPELNSLELSIRNLKTSRFDSTREYDHYNEKNMAYFSAAKNHLDQISDSLLKITLSNLLAASLERYHLHTLKHHDILETIESKDLQLNDLHTFLKIIKTIPVIEQYQKENLPAANPMEGFLNSLNQTIEKTDSLIKK